MTPQKKAEPHLNDKLIPLVMGVTGHRDLRLEDHASLERVVRQVFEKFRNRYPNTPLLVLSPLAEGADRLVARVARDAGVGLIVPLPMQSDLYDRDFADDASRNEFKDLLSHAESSFTLPMVSADNGLGSYRQVRDRQYEQVGAYIVRHSQILLALWDGEDSSLTGGTSRIVRFQMEGVPEPYAPRRSFFDEVESGPVYHIVTPRVKNPRPRGTPFTIRKIFPVRYADKAKSKKGETFDRIYRNIDTFNSNVAKASGLAQQIRKSKQAVFPDSDAQELPLFLTSLRDRYAAADSLAIHFRKLTDQALIGLYLLVFLAAVVVDVYAHLIPDKHAILIGYLAIMGLAFTLIFFVKKREYENNHQDYRALAEGMRVQFFWCLANLKLSVAEHYLRKQRSELDWICAAISAWTIPVDTEGWSEVHSDPASRARMELILKYWVKDQADWHKRTAKHEKAKLEKYKPWRKRFLLFGVTVALLIVLGLAIPHPWKADWHEWLEHHATFHHFAIVLLTLPPVAAALLHSFIEKAAFSEHLKQYSRMHLIFGNAEAHLKRLIDEKDYVQSQRAIEALGKEALEENGDWVLLHRERPLEMVQ